MDITFSRKYRGLRMVIIKEGDSWGYAVELKNKIIPLGSQHSEMAKLIIDEIIERAFLKEVS